MPIVDLPDGSEIEFPDTMSPDEINSAVRKHLGGPTPKSDAPGALHVFARSLRGGVIPGESYGYEVGLRGAAGERIPGQSFSDPIGADIAQAARFAANPFQNAAPLPTVSPNLKPEEVAQLAGQEEATWNKAKQEHRYADVIGSMLPAAVGVSSQLASRKMLPSLMHKSPQALLLERQGVEGLTPGQLTTSEGYRLLEQATAQRPFGLEKARQQAKESWRLSELAKSVKEGEPPLPGDVQKAFAEAYARFEPQYAELKQAPVAGEVLQQLPERALAMPSKGVPQDVRSQASAEIRNALSVLDKGTPEKPMAILDEFGQPFVTPAIAPIGNAGDLMKVRSEIRERLRAAVRSQDFDRQRILGHAEDTVTDALRKSLDPTAKAALDETDLRYAKLMTIESASPAGRTDFTPNQLLRAVEHRMGRRSFKAGAAGEMQKSGEAARDVFEDLPKTGFVPGLLAGTGAKYWGAPLTQVGASDAGRRLLFGGRTQMPMPAPVSDAALLSGSVPALQQSPDVVARIVSLLRRARLQSAPAGEDQ